MASALLARRAEPRPSLLILSSPVLRLSSDSQKHLRSKEVPSLWTKAHSPEGSWCGALVKTTYALLGLDLSRPKPCQHLQLDSIFSPRGEQGILGGPLGVLPEGHWAPGDKEQES